MVWPTEGRCCAVRRPFVVERFLVLLGRVVLDLRVVDDRVDGARPRDDFVRAEPDRVERFEDFDDVATVLQH